MYTEILKYDHQKESGRTKIGAKRRPLPARLRARRELPADDREIVKAALEARDEWIETGINFEHVHEDLLVDYYSYKLKACEARYTYFVRLAKERGLSRYI